MSHELTPKKLGLRIALTVGQIAFWWIMYAVYTRENAVIGQLYSILSCAIVTGINIFWLSCTILAEAQRMYELL